METNKHTNLDSEYLLDLIEKFSFDIQWPLKLSTYSACRSLINSPVNYRSLLRPSKPPKCMGPLSVKALHFPSSSWEIPIFISFSIYELQADGPLNDLKFKTVEIIKSMFLDYNRLK